MAFLYTKAAIHKTIQDIRKATNIFSLCSLALSIAVPLVAVLQKRQILLVHIALLVASLAFGAVTLVAFLKECKQPNKKTKLLYRRTKRILRGVNLAFIFYGFLLSDGATSNLSAVFSVFSAMAWTAELLLSLLIHAVEKRAEYFLQGFMEDVKNVPFLNDIVANGLGREFCYDGEKTSKMQELETIIDEHKDEWQAKAQANKQKTKLRRKMRRYTLLKAFLPKQKSEKDQQDL